VTAVHLVERVLLVRHRVPRLLESPQQRPREGFSLHANTHLHSGHIRYFTPLPS
jgi:hypothetical protein